MRAKTVANPATRMTPMTMTAIRKSFMVAGSFKSNATLDAFCDVAFGSSLDGSVSFAAVLGVCCFNDVMTLLSRRGLVAVVR